VPLLGTEGLSVDPSAQRRQPQKAHLSANRYFSTSLSFPNLLGAQGLTLHPYAPVSKKQWANPSASSLTDTKEGEDAPTLQMNLRAERSARAFETNTSLFLSLCYYFIILKNVLIILLSLQERGRMAALNADGKNRESNGTEGVIPA